jgi:hypothetical protein
MKKIKIVEYFKKGFIILGIKKENRDFIEQDLNDMNFEFVECEGTYKNIERIPSLIILDDNRNHLKNIGIDIINKYNQETFLFKPSITLDENAYLIDGFGKIKKYYNQYVINDNNQKYYTRLTSGDCFSFIKENNYERK